MQDHRRFLGAVAIAGSLLIAAYLSLTLGLFDGMVRGRTADIAQLKNQEWANSWFGVGLLQYPNDLMTYQQIIADVRPDVIIETGTYSGGLTLFLSSLLDYINPEGKIVSIDIDTKPARKNFGALEIARKARILGRIVLIERSSTAPETIAEIREHVGPESKVLIILDSLHTRENVLRELELYAPFVSVGSYIVVNDTHLYRWYPESGDENVPYGGARQAALDFLARDDRLEVFEVDWARDRFLVSCAPGGFLKRVR